MPLEYQNVDYERTISALNASIAATPHHVPHHIPPHGAPPPEQPTIFTKLHDFTAPLFPLLAPVLYILKVISICLLRPIFHHMKVDLKFIIIILVLLSVFLFYIFWEVIQVFCGLLISVITTTTSLVSSVGKIGTCVMAPAPCLWAICESFLSPSASASRSESIISSQTPILNINTKQKPIPLIPMLNNEDLYETWSKNLHSLTQEPFEATDTTTTPRNKQNGHDQIPITSPSITDLILSTSHIQSALLIIADRNDVALNDQTITLLLPTLETLQTNILRLSKIYSNFRSKWAQKLSHVALQSQGIAGRVLALEDGWEAILDESCGFGEGVPDSNSALRQANKHQYEQTLLWSWPRKSPSRYSTFEHLARAKYQQILVARRDHSILMKNLARDSKKDSIEMTGLLSDIEKEVVILDTLANLAKEEKEGMEIGRRNNWNEQEKALWNYFGWTTWTAVWTVEEREERAKEMDMIQRLVKDVVHVKDLSELIKSIRDMIDKDESIWRELLVGSEKFLILQGFVKESRDGDTRDVGRIFVEIKTEELVGGIRGQEGSPERKEKTNKGNWGKGHSKSEGGKEDEKDEKEKSGLRILELKQWGKDVREWAFLRQEFSRELMSFVENR